MDVDKLLTELEKYRAKHDLGKTQMSIALGAKQYQNYADWLRRDQIPTAFQDRARELLRLDTPIGRLDAQIFDDLAKLSEAEALDVIGRVRKYVPKS